MPDARSTVLKLILSYGMVGIGAHLVWREYEFEVQNNRKVPMIRKG
jgi:hypothetical protein